MATTQEKLYDVGGVTMPRPFKIRRLGHFGFNVYDMEAGLRFYKDLLGFKVSDHLNFKGNPQRAEMLKDVADKDCLGAFMHHGGDHHSFVLFPKKALDVMGRGSGHEGDGDVTINQITWQTGSLAEVVNGQEYFNETGIPIRRTGRDMPGSNWHTYVWDPDENINELYYGIEQIGWLGRSKPRPMHYRGFGEAPTLPQMSEEAEVDEAVEKGIEIFSGTRDTESTALYLRRGRYSPAQALQNHQDWSCQPFRPRPGRRPQLLCRAAGFRVYRRGELQRPPLRLHAQWQ